MTITDSNKAEAKRFKAAIARARKAADQYRSSFENDDRQEVERLRMAMIRARDRVASLDRWVDGEEDTRAVWDYCREAWEERDRLRLDFLAKESKRLHELARRQREAAYAWM